MKCEKCDKELLPGLVAVGIKTCLECRDPEAYASIGTGGSKQDDEIYAQLMENEIKKRKAGYIGDVGGYD